MAPAAAAISQALALYGAGILVESTDADAALAYYLQALRRVPSYELLYVRAALLMVKQGRSADGIALMEEACRRNPQSIEARLYLAQVFQALNQPARAEAVARQAIALDPADIRGHLHLATLLILRQERGQAVTVLEQARTRMADNRPVLRSLGDLYAQELQAGASPTSPALALAIARLEADDVLPPDEDTPTYRARLADLYLLARRYDRALDRLQELAARDSNDEALQKKLALCHAALGHHDKAVEILKRVAGRDPNNPMVQYYLGELYETLGRTNLALASFRSAVDAATSPSAQPYLKLAAYYLLSNPEQAVKTMESGRERFPDDPAVLELLLESHLRANRGLDAIQVFEQWQNLIQRRGLRPRDPRLFVEFGMLAQKAGWHACAEAFYDKALELDPALIEAHLRLAFLQLAEYRDPDAAVNAIGDAVTACPEDPVAWYYCALIYTRAGMYPPAVRAFARVADLAARSPKGRFLLDADYYFNYGAACERAGDAARAETLLARAIRLDPGHSEAFNYLAYMWADRGVHLDLARDYVLHALDGEPDSAAFLDTLGWIAYRQGRYPEARDLLAEALLFDPEEPTILDHMGDVCAALGHADEARRYWQRSLDLDPANAALRAKLAKFRLSLP